MKNLLIVLCYDESNNQDLEFHVYLDDTRFFYDIDNISNHYRYLNLKLKRVYFSNMKESDF